MHTFPPFVFNVVTFCTWILSVQPYTRWVTSVGSYTQGEDYHYHGDPFGTKCLYSEADYIGLTHPPIIGYSLDGHAIHGRHTATSQEGIDTDLDSCGGHTHDAYGYHYHATVTLGRTTTTLDGVGGSGSFTYNTFDIAPSTCWKGDVSLIPNYWSGDQVSGLLIEVALWIQWIKR